jgi:hypothetical protein
MERKSKLEQVRRNACGMIIDDGRLIAFLDGELDAADRAEVEAALSLDPLLAARLAKLRSVRARISEVYAPLAEDAVHERVANGRDNVVRLADRRQPPSPSRPKLNLKWPAWGGLAATFAGGLVLGYAAAHEGGGVLSLRGDGVLMARGDLVRALNENRAGEAGPIRIGTSFKAADQRYCRTFQVETRRVAGVACREGPGWVARMTATDLDAKAGGPTSAPTASGMPSSVQTAAAAMAVGAPLDEAAERLARARGWKD